MKVCFNSALHLSDTLVPDVFISDYMNKLSNNAIRSYLIVLLTYQHGNRNLSAAEIAQRLGISKNDAEKALSELQDQQLIIIQSGQLEIIDLKIREVKRNYAKKKTDDKSSQADVSEREAIIGQINDTFFQGVMSLGYYTKIDEWFSRYQFEPEVVYAIFSEAASRNKLDGPGYVSGIADNWAANGVKSYGQLNQYYKDYENNRIIINKIREKLNIRNRFSVYQEEIVAKWLNQYHYDFTIIELALAETINLNSPNLKYVDSILTNWHKKGLTTVEEIKQEKESFRKRNLAKRNQKKQTGKRKLQSDEQAKLDVQEEDLYNTDLIQLYSEQEAEV
ncbi:MAG TPA: DnaD domain protein [Candidatus Eisenbacteria bacterium]|nr:DnaD domain protein [Candidatus Eisenbacteria bacterium]